jgi:hypothetical protein
MWTEGISYVGELVGEFAERLVRIYGSSRWGRRRWWWIQRGAR